ncbi:tRNA (adenosine(37)-N6)-threonylcarbamoyltransferase complex ATPase subunit type 1 TsaE [Candidatus Dependentiae bacterium]|nr:tRNA (adenosine(37)-N6)-threonylcarbamoyltransferase complex ATPase subunit type 1 TsaE [Candidatus Dependentiae bacterium]
MKKYDIKHLDKIVEKILIPRLDEFKIFTFRGPLGAGKTTLIKELLRKCGVSEVVTSPTFNYVNTYVNLQGQVFNHFDLYRITSIDNFLELGLDEYLYKNEKTWNLIEWPEVIDSLLNKIPLKNKVFKIFITYNGNELDKRIIKSS